jgi:hypothetical protein
MCGEILNGCLGRKYRFVETVDEDENKGFIMQRTKLGINHDEWINVYRIMDKIFEDMLDVCFTSGLERVQIMEKSSFRNTFIISIAKENSRISVVGKKEIITTFFPFSSITRDLESGDDLLKTLKTKIGIELSEHQNQKLCKVFQRFFPECFHSNMNQSVGVHHSLSTENEGKQNEMN